MRIGTQDFGDETLDLDQGGDRRRADQAALFALPGAASGPLAPAPIVHEPPAAPASGWRGGAECLTLATQRALAASGLTRAQGDSRFFVQIDAGELGTMGLVVKRTDAGLALVLMVDSDAAWSAVELERPTLLGALRATGLVIASLVITRTGGTDLAPKPGAMTRAHENTPESDDAGGAGKGPRKRARLLNTVG
jgi:hypothetical protein